MEKNKRNDLRINGVGSSAGGHFDHVQINGKGDINGDLDCNELQINGMASVRGNVHTQTFRVSGKSDVSGNVESIELTIDGKINISGEVKAGEIQNHGMLGVSRELSSESFISHGGFKIGGLLNAGKIQILVYAPCSAKEIGGEEIEVRSGGPSGLRAIFGSLLGGPLKTILSTGTIEGDHIYLENTIAKVVRGQDVTIGPGCQIELVEYKNEFHKDNDSGTRVNESKKI